MLHLAVKNGDFELAESLLDENASIEAPNKLGETPLHVAVSEGKMNLVCLLLDHGADINRTNKRGQTPLHIAVEIGHEDSVHLLLNRKACVDLADSSGMTPLFVACRKGILKIVELLIDSGADNENKCSPFPPLHLASLEGHTEILNLLIDKGWNPNSIVKARKDFLCKIGLKEISGCAPLHIACKKQHLDAAELLLNRSADVDALNGKNKTPLYLSVGAGWLPMIECILRHNPDINNKNNIAAFKVAVLGHRKIHKIITKKLINYGFTFTTEDVQNLQLLQNAIKRGYTEIVDFFLANVADLKSSKSNETLLHTAARFGHKKIIKLLLDAGWDGNAKDKQGQTPFTIFVDNQGNNCSRDTVKLLYDNDGKSAPTVGSLHKAVAKGHYQLCKILIELGADVNAPDELGETPILHLYFNIKHRIERHITVKIAELLLEQNATVNAKTKCGLTALHQVINTKSVDLVQVLLKHGADPNSETKNGDTCLHMACSPLLIHLQVVECLIKAGAKVNVRNGRGDTPLHNAYYYLELNSEAVKVLLENGSDVNALNNLGQTALNNVRQSTFGHPRFSFSNTLLKHVIKLKIAGFHICQENLDVIQAVDSKDFEIECNEEIKKASYQKLGCCITLKDILVGNRKPAYVNNEDLVKNFESLDLEGFPIYRNILTNNFKHDQQRNKLLTQGCKWFLSLIITRNVLCQDKLQVLPGELIERILLYVNIGTLQSLITCGEQLFSQLNRP